MAWRYAKKDDLIAEADDILDSVNKFIINLFGTQVLRKWIKHILVIQLWVLEYTLLYLDT